MATLASSAVQSPATIPSTTRIGYVHLTVNDLARQVQFYTQVLGFTLHSRTSREVTLGTPEEILLRLSEDPAARPAPHAAGMYHFAILYPNRKELARAIARLFALRWPNSPTDHGISKTTYLEDVEGNTIELYVRSLEDAVYDFSGNQLVVRYADGRIGSGRDPLDVKALFATLSDDDQLDLPLPVGTRIGHMHLYAASLQAQTDFYAGVLGFQVGPVIPSFRMGEVGLDDLQPHVVAYNTWKGSQVQPAEDNALGMRWFSIVLPSAEELQCVLERVQAAGIAAEETQEGWLVRDPANIRLMLTDKMPLTDKER